MPTRTPHPVLERCVLIAVLLLVLVLRLSYVDRHGIWADEAFRYYIALGNRDMVRMSQTMVNDPVTLSSDTHAMGSTHDTFHLLKHQSPYFPAYYLLIRATVGLTGTESFTLLKAWNVLFGVLTALALWLLARRGLSIAGAAMAVVLYGFSTWDMGVGLQLKAQGLACLCIAASTWHLDRLVMQGEKARTKDILAYGSILGIGLLTHGHVLFAAALHAVYVVVMARSTTGATTKSTARLIARSTGPSEACPETPLPSGERLGEGASTSGVRPSPDPSLGREGGSWMRFNVRKTLPWFRGALLAGGMAGIWIVYAGKAQMAHLQGVNALFGGDFGGLAALPSRLWLLFATNLCPAAAIEYAPPQAIDQIIVAVFIGLMLIGALGWLNRRPEAKRIARLSGLVAIGSVALAIFNYAVMKQNQAIWPRYFVLFFPLGYLAIAAALDGLIERISQRQTGIRTFRPVLAATAWAAAFCATAAIGNRAVQHMYTGDRLDLYIDWREATNDLAEHIPPESVIVHGPPSNAFLAFAAYWEQANLHFGVTSDKPIDEAIQSITTLRPGEPVWYLLAWGMEERTDEIVSEMQNRGYVLGESIGLQQRRLVVLRFEPEPGRSR